MHSAAASENTRDDHLLTIPEATQMMRISRRHFFNLKRRGHFKTVSLGRRTLVPVSEITRLIDEALDSDDDDAAVAA